MEFIADMHIHSKYSRACSKDLDIKNLEKWARIKGVNLLGTGDFTHPLWIKELKNNLTETEKDTGFFQTKTGFPFVLQTEISLIYTHENKGRRIHNLVFAPSFQAVDEITKALLKRGRVDYDGRPIFKIPCPDFVESMKKIDERIQVIPAHCLLPTEKVVCNPKAKTMSDITVGDMVLTHKGNFKHVKQVFKRPYMGKAYRIQPYYFREGVSVTEEHPFLIIKPVKNCSFVGGLCKPNSVAKGKHQCTKKHYNNYKPQWVQAKNLEKNDIILYPVLKETKNIKNIKILSVINNHKYRISEGCIVPNSGRQDKAIKNTVEINNNFCRLAGYFLAEGYINKKKSVVQFSFGPTEKEYIDDVAFLMQKCFGVKLTKIRERKGYELYFFSKALSELFEALFYQKEEQKRAFSKKLPEWMIYLPTSKQAEILRGWWRGDAGWTTSEVLGEQMKMICLRLGILPSISRITKEKHNSKPHLLGDRVILAKNDFIVFGHLSFYKDELSLLTDTAFKKFKSKLERKHGWMDSDYFYIPIKAIDTFDYSGFVYNMEVEDDNSYVTSAATVHNCWTPWFGLYGANGGFDSLKECFQDQLKNVHAVETGLSSDPAMNWRLKELDNINLVSFSDLHSFWPWRMGREATLFDIEPNFNALAKALETGKELKETIEVNPNLGKYHFTGHRNCNISFSPEESKKLKDICPKCGKTLTVGVDQRVEELANRSLGYKPEHAKPYLSLLPLSDMLSMFHKKAVASKGIWELYNQLVNKTTSEFDILLKNPISEIAAATSPEFAEIVQKNREGKIKVKPGYDGVYGVPILSEEDEEKYEKERRELVTKLRQKQTGLQEFLS